MGFLAAAIVLTALTVAYAAALSYSVRHRALARLYAYDDTPAAVRYETTDDVPLARWLSRAGFRSGSAPAVFVASTVVGVVTGALAGQFYRLTLERSLVGAIANAVGGAGEVGAAILQSGPWILFVMGAILPTVIVRMRRRRRVEAIEQDLPLMLELLATMAEAGLGFDEALTRIVRSQRRERPLMDEIRHFQADVAGGIPRLQALRQLARRAEVPTLTTFTSALIQAEQIGASMAETVRHQADDLRHRRRENALLKAQALPVKLVFPLVICFLPGIFVSTLAPVIYQMIQVANGVIRSGGR